MIKAPGLIQKYHQVVKSEGFQIDPEQQKSVKELQRLLTQKC